MSWLKRVGEAIIGSEDFSDIKSSSLRDIINGNILTNRFLQKQYGLILLIAVLTFLYVDNRYYCETQLAKEIELKKDIQDVKYESLTISAELMQISRQSNVLKMINERGVNLIRTSAPSIVIEEDSVAKK
jgi:hypothetical protein